MVVKIKMWERCQYKGTIPDEIKHIKEKYILVRWR
jgi:hypothetical protein